MGKESKVYIVGAGPGNWQLISVRGIQILRRADCVIYDRLIDKELLNFIPKKAKLAYVGKEHKGKSLKQKDINRLIVENARIYKTIVRLKGGDAMIFGRASEELKCLLDNKIDFEIIPGITAASAAAACGGIVLTDRDTASSVTFVTGQGAEGKEIDIDLKNLAKLGGTIVFYMAVKNMKQICRKLIKSGLAADCAAIVIANALMENQKIVKGTVSNIADKCDKENIQPPAVVIIGKNCFSRLAGKPLFGKKILITRDSTGNSELAFKLAAKGAQAIDCPTFEIQDLTNRREFKQVISKIKNFDWVFFTSSTGIKLFFRAISRLNKDVRIFADVKVACIGKETAETLEDFGIKADFVPKVFTSEKLAADFKKKYSPAGKKILLLRSALADSLLAERLKSAGAKVKAVSVYTAKKINNKNNKISEKLSNGNIDWIAFASSFAVKCFSEDFNASKINPKIKFASIGPATSETLKKSGIVPIVEAKEHTFDGLIDAMGKFYD